MSETEATTPFPAAGLGGDAPSRPAELEKVPTGIRGLDELARGGLPAGRPTLVCGGPGCGKSLIGMHFLARGALDHGEPGVLVSFEEPRDEIARNVASLGIDVDDLERRDLLRIDHVHIDRSEIEETGDYDLEGLFIRIGFAVDAIGARRIVLDTIESLFAGFTDEGVLRAELRRLFSWIRSRGLTAVVTAERGGGALTRHGLEEYVSDCVILVDHRIEHEVSTRRLRIVKYRGSPHATNEFPFLITETGISVLPLSSLRLEHGASDERISTGLADLDGMLGGGYHRGSTVLVAGTAGTGKTSLAAHFAAAAAGRGERTLYFSFEESPAQLRRNMASIGLDLETPLRAGTLRIVSKRPSAFGLEMHLVALHQEAEDFAPRHVILDPVSSLTGAGSDLQAHDFALRLIDHLKSRDITLFMTSLAKAGEDHDSSGVGISSLVDAWVYLKDIDDGVRRSRVLYVLKARGTAHSSEMRRYRITSQGVRLDGADAVPRPSPAAGAARADAQARSHR